jgi:tetratricopeptide (TPR) repeat protein
MARKRASDAFVEAQKALALVPDHYESNLVQGLARWQNGETAESERFFRLAIAKDDSRADAHLGLGRLLLTLARTDEGIAELTKAHAADEQNPEASYALASALGSDAKVQSLLESAVQVRPGFGHAHAKLAEFFLNAMNWDAAENSARAALACSAPEVEWHALLGMALLRKNQLDPAMSEAETTLRSNPVSATAKLLQGEVYAARGDIDLAIEAFQASYSNARTVPTALIRGAEACLRAGRETTARAFAEKATQTFANWGPGWVVFGDILARAGEKSQAREAYRHALSADGPVDKTAVARKIDQLR